MTKEITLQTFPKKVSDGANVTFCSRVLHSQDVATGKARLPMAERQVCLYTYTVCRHLSSRSEVVLTSDAVRQKSERRSPLE